MTDRIRHDYRVAYRHPKKRSDTFQVYVLAAFLFVVIPLLLALLHDAATYEHEGHCGNCIVLDVSPPGLKGCVR